MVNNVKFSYAAVRTALQVTIHLLQVHLLARPRLPQAVAERCTKGISGRATGNDWTLILVIVVEGIRITIVVGIETMIVGTETAAINAVSPTITAPTGKFTVANCFCFYKLADAER